MSDYIPEKWVWTDADFDQMSWHDVHVHSTAFDIHSFALDIDYMVKWVSPAPGETYYKFWISPATLLFEHVADLAINLDANFGGPTILDVQRDEPYSVQGHSMTWWNWHIGCVQGNIQFRATGFKQFIRKKPQLATEQYLRQSERGGISFSQETP